MTPETTHDYPGARFYKTDLHLHTPASKCWKGSDGDDEFKRIFERLKDQGIEVVAITDHNTVAGLQRAKKLGKKSDIHVYPGVEISTKEGHVLAIFDPGKPLTEIEQWLSTLGFPPDKKGDPKIIAVHPGGAHMSITEVFSLIERADGVAIAPHPNSKGTGFMEVLKQRASPREAAYNCVALRGLDGGKNAMKIRQLAAGEVDGFPKKYGVVSGSDAHAIDEIGLAYSFLKFGDTGIEALKQVFYDPGMRIRSRDEWPLPKHAWIESLTVSQGFFKKVEFRFHPDMNCVVGGKAVGKSLLIELIRFALGIESPIAEINKESESKIRASVCLGDGGTVTVNVVSAGGDRYCIERTVSDLDEGPDVYYADAEKRTIAAESVDDVFPCKIYSQNEVIELGRSLPALLYWLDGFVELGPDRLKANGLKGKIVSVLKKLDEAHEAASGKEVLEKKKKDLEGKKKLLEGKIKDPILQAFPGWEKEQRYLSKVQDGLTRLREDFVQRLRETNVEEYLPPPEKGTPNQKKFEEEWTRLLGLKEALEKAATTVETALVTKQGTFDRFLGNWKRKFEDAARKHERLIKEAEVTNASALTSELNKATKALEKVEENLKRARVAAEQEKLFAAKVRGTLMPKYNATFAEIYRKRSEKATTISLSLGSFVRILVRQMADRSEFEEALISTFRGSGLRKTELQQIAGRITPLELAIKLVEKDVKSFSRVTGLKPDRVSVLIDHIWDRAMDTNGTVRPSMIYKLGLIELRDEVQVELEVDKDTYKPMNELSVGSKCTAILSVALVEGDCPLIVDQPEDALDNLFVFEEIVKTVRRSKAGRQYLFATHNSNVAVSSDADLIYCLKATAREGSVDKHGSIDEISTRDRVVANLEGGEDAFRLRSQKYDITIRDPNAVVLDITIGKDVGRTRRTKS